MITAPFNYMQHLPTGEVPVQLGVNVWVDPSDSDNYTLVSGKYSQIVNKGDMGGTIDQATSTMRPPQLTDHFGTGLHALQGDGSDDILDVTGSWDILADDLAFSFFLVIDYVTGGNDGVIGFNAGDLLIESAEYMRMWNGSGSVRLSAGSYTNGKKIIEVHRTAGSTFTVYENGVDDTASGPPNDSRDFTTVNKMFSTSAWESNKKHGSILLFNYDLDGSGDAAAVRSYLNDKWSIY